MPDEIKKRFTAFKLPIGLIQQGQIEFEQEKFSRLVLGNKEVVRVNLIGTVVDKFINDESTYASITIDDGTGTIRVKVFSDNIEMLKEVQLGNTLTIIGVLRYFNNELYILPDIVKEIDARWLLARKLELQKEYDYIYNTKVQAEVQTKVQLAQSQLQQQTEITQEKIQPDIETIKVENKVEGEDTEPEKTEKSLRDQVLEIIKAAEAEEGIDVDKLIMALKAPVDNINSTIIELLEEGTIFEPRPGRLRTL